ncbi:response regulator transcription factor [Methylobacterium sp. NEAU K]|uniref:response regulator transcription factor n=1 Tax=Methylobacterium sp. NEAU K TaxID=3064946 RepID=UPI002737049E|nr:response regulator [Methylobacterium sp. NEAU K]MDP4002675.1 response regulator [Methylobacterium sp. NEAU K]
MRAAAGTIHVVDDDDAMRHSLALLLGALGHRIEEYHGAARLLADVERLTGCVVADVRMPHVDGLEMLDRMRAAGSTVPVVMMTGHGDIPTAVRAMKLGASDFLEKPFTTPLLLGAVDAALGGGNAAGMRHEADAAFAAQVEGLTGRERDVFEHVLLGRTNKEIGLLLDISHRTVEIHRAKVMTKTGCSCVQSLVRKSAKAGLL